MAISLGGGASTFALIFYFMAKRDPTLRETGRSYQKVVHIVLRIAMVLILLTEITKGVLYSIFASQKGATFTELFAADDLMFMWTVVIVLFLNAVLMTVHLMPMKLGPAIQATSWYTLSVLTALPMITMSYAPLILTYLGCTIGFAVVIEMITQKVTLKTVPEGATEILVVVTDAASDL